MINRKTRILNYINARWNSPEEKYRNFEYIAKFHRLKTNPADTNIVDPVTWNNLNMNNLFEMMDRNISCIGQQYLFHTMSTYKSNNLILQHNARKYDDYIKDTKLRQEIQKALMALRNSNSYDLVNLLYSKLPQKPKYYFVFYILSFLSLASLAAIPFYHASFFIFLFFGAINIIINWQFSSRIFSHFSELAGINSLLSAAIKLSKCNPEASIEQLDVISKVLQPAKLIKKSIAWLIIDKSRLDDIAIAFVEYLNQFMLFELVTFLRSLNKLEKYKSELVEIFEAVASLDSEIAIAAYLNSCKNYCTPEINSVNLFELDSVYHPLLVDAVSNDFKLSNKSVLITGSNMAGKTTFIKTIGINLILAKTIGIVLAKKASVPDLRVLASIKITDDLSKNKSYYFTEVEEILTFINKCKEKDKYLFLIDEIYKGTNTAERISASKAVLNYLSKNSIAMVTTHDLELEELLDNYEMYNFNEQLKDLNIYFDYKIKRGKCTGRNAIKLLEISGYPKEIITEAMKEYDLFSSLKTIN